MSAARPGTGQYQGRSATRRVAYAGLAAALHASAVALIVVWDVAGWQTVAFALGPDLAASSARLATADSWAVYPP